VDRTFPEIDPRTRQLLERDFLYEHPESFRAGVLAAVQILSERADAPDQDAPLSVRRAGA